MRPSSRGHPLIAMLADHSTAVPHLITAQSGPLQELEAHLLSHQTHIETWLRQQFLTTPPPFYASVDLRNAGFKLAPVDTNLFPAGFNNLNPDFNSLCVQAAMAAVEHVRPTTERVMIIPENHTRNQFYLQSLATLAHIMDLAGFEVRIGTLNPDITEATDIALPNGDTLRLEPVQRHGDRVRLSDFDPCLVLLNNDLASGTPEILQGIEQAITPSLNLGWANRLKSAHFSHYEVVSQEISEIIDIDPWFMSPLFENCGEINFMEREGEECLADKVEHLLDLIADKYREHKIDQEPFVIVKADAGTYGMGIMTAKHANDVRGMNRKQRTRMASRKGGDEVTQVIVQEGVPTYETWDQGPAEPVVYMIDRFVVGGFYRVHTKRGIDENLNAPGMHFEPLAFANSCITPDRCLDPDAEPNRFYAYGVVARMALLAAARERAQELAMGGDQ